MGKFALVTGASSGIGREMALQLAERGYGVVLVARRRERLEELRNEILKRYQVSVEVLPLDLSEAGAALAVKDFLDLSKIELEVLVNNAGIGMGGRFLEMKLEEIERMFQLNMLTLTHLTQLCARDMVARGNGYILNVASAAAFLPSPYVSAYSGTKAYVLNFSEGLRFELRGTGVSVTTLYPGVTTTEFNDVAEVQHPPMMNASVLTAAQVARIGLRAMFRRRRSIVPGFINKMNAFFSQAFHRGVVTWAAGSLLKKANKL